MRFWRRRPPPAPALPPASDMLVTEEVLRRCVDGVLAVRERQIRGGIVVFRGSLLGEPARALDTLLARFKPFGYTPFLRADGGEVVLSAWPLADTTTRSRVRVNVALFILTCVSMLLTGSIFISGSPTFDAFRELPTPFWFLSGVPFAGTLLAILLVHEFGHYLTARHYGASVSLPFFIPLPLPPLGTLGAVIRMGSPGRDRNTLFDIAAAGPLAGLALALPAIVLGLSWSRLVPSSEPLAGFGDSVLWTSLVHLMVGPIPEGMRLFTHPVADAGWAALLVTGINLFPVGQLDGGRIAYAMFGRYHRYVGMACFVLMLVVGALTLSPNWFVWAGLVFFVVGFDHSPPLDAVTPLSRSRLALGVVCLVLVVLLVPPVIA